MFIVHIVQQTHLPQTFEKKPIVMRLLSQYTIYLKSHSKTLFQHKNQITLKPI